MANLVQYMTTKHSRAHAGFTICERGLLAICAGFIALAAIDPQQCAGQSQEPAPTATALPLVHPGAGQESGPPLTLTLRDAIDRAQKYDATYWSSVLDARIAREDAVIARAGILPAVSESTQELLTKGNGALPSGRFVTNDGVHVYREWGIVHQDLSPNTYMLYGLRRASVAVALANAKAEIAKRGLVVAVTKAYYGLVVAQRKYATAQLSLDTASHFLEITRDRDRLGEAAHSDTVKAELQSEQQKQAFQEAQLDMDSARIALGILVLPNFSENIAVVDDLSSAQPLPTFEDVRAMASRGNPTLRAAIEATHQARVEVAASKLYFLPTITLEADNGIEANQFALRGHIASDSDPHRLLPQLGFFVTGTLNFPVFDWGASRAKYRQNVYKAQQAQVELTQTQREMLSNLYSYYNEALAAKSEQETLHHAAELAAESLRLTGLRYQAGESTAQELVDAQLALTQARNADDDGQLRYRTALANLQTLTGKF